MIVDLFVADRASSPALVHSAYLYQRLPVRMQRCDKRGKGGKGGKGGGERRARINVGVIIVTPAIVQAAISRDQPKSGDYLHIEWAYRNPQIALNPLAPAKGQWPRSCESGLEALKMPMLFSRCSGMGRSV